MSRQIRGELGSSLIAAHYSIWRWYYAKVSIVSDLLAILPQHNSSPNTYNSLPNYQFSLLGAATVGPHDNGV